MSKRNKIIESAVQPNPKEAEIWIKPNRDGTREIKQFNSNSNKFEGGGGNSDSNGINIEYYKYKIDTNWDPDDPNLSIITNISYMLPAIYNFIYGESASNMHNHAIGMAPFLANSDNYRALAVAIITTLKSAARSSTDDAWIIIPEGTFQERVNYMCGVMNVDRINVYDYFDPITEE